ncbi:FAD-dependent monooxygenase [Streptomyces sp. NPDC088733]|uniref:FAD binding domain-containing protein n=1 Tax=Streptomyces sp. NPDC088733 TaxID=3365880 RepID=UPI0038099AE5
MVVGGSLGGLAAAHELRAAGADVAVHERSAPRTPAHGAGIVVRPDIEALLHRLGVPVEAVAVELYESRRLDVDGRAVREEAPQWMTAWDVLHRVLREPLADVCHRLDGALRRVRVEGHEVTAEFSDGYTAHGNFLVGADGIGSATRRLLDPSFRPAYAGYVGWRGLEPESRLPGDLRELLSGRLTHFTSDGMQMLCSLVPGPGGELEKGARRVNWVWYVNVAERDLPALLPGRSARRSASFLPPGDVPPETAERVVREAEASLPPALAELVRLSDPFAQPVLDVPPWRMVADHAALIGDAAGTVRPHTSVAASKAFGDAAGLATALLGWTPAQPLPAVALEHWEVLRLDRLVTLAGTGRELAAASGLGVGAGRTFFTGD